ncbi:hypothetical protein C8R47DRAFT_598356 [Mycena vitilis]|nr:hypothetical protein C8R47DRAFT_598356 [Mycena vitilis]
MFSSPASSSSSSSSSSGASSYASGSGSSWSSPASSSSGSARSSPVHPGSLVDPATHAPALMQLIDIKLDPHVIDYVVDCVAETVDYAMGRTAPSSSIPPRSASTTNYLPKFTSFVTTVLSRAEVTPPTLLVALAYTHRARPHLSIALEEWALERVFLGALIAASKYTNDSTLKNVHWALCTGVFGKRDVGRIEREFLDVLDWELGVREADLLAHHEGLVRAAERAVAPTPAVASTSAARARTTARPAGARLAAPRAHAHRRRPSAGAVVPELEPSSPQSSLASLSPRTPPHSSSSSHPYPSSSHSSSSYPTSHAYAPYPSHRPAHPAPMPMDVDTPQKDKCAGKWNDLLRSFPIPRHHRAGHVSSSAGGRRVGVGA